MKPDSILNHVLELTKNEGDVNNKELVDLQSMFINLPEFKGYYLTTNDIVPLAFIWDSYLRSARPITNWEDLSELTGMVNSKGSVYLNYVKSMVERNILYVPETQTKYTPITLIDILSKGVVLRREVRTKILEVDAIGLIEQKTPQTWSGDEEFLNDLFRGVKMVQSNYRDLLYVPEVDQSRSFVHPHYLFKSADIFYRRLLKHRNKLLFADAIIDYGLDLFEFTILVLVAYTDFHTKTHIDRDYLLQLVTEDRAKYKENMAYLKPEGKLFKYGLIEYIIIVSDDECKKNTKTIRLKPSLFSKLANKKKEQEAGLTKFKTIKGSEGE